MNELLGSINFQGERFSVLTATIEGILNTSHWAKFHGRPYCIKWYIELTAKSIDKGRSLEISFNGLGLHLTSWRDLACVDVCWDTWQNPTTNSPYARVEAEEIYSPDSGTFRVVGSSENVFLIQSIATAEGNALYTMDAEFHFQGIRVFGETSDTEADLRRRLETELPRDQLLLTDFSTNLQTAQTNTSAYFRPKSN